VHAGGDLADDDGGHDDKREGHELSTAMTFGRRLTATAAGMTMRRPGRPISGASLALPILVQPATLRA
jgi:hypothetical protein